MKTGLRVLLVYPVSKPDYQHVSDDLRRRTVESGGSFEVLDPEKLTSLEEERLLEEIRAIPPQLRGQVRSGGKRVLPITHSGKVNRLIPILMLYDGSKLIDVYPKELMGVPHTLTSAFEAQTLGTTLGLENSLVTVLSSKPDLLGPGLELVEKEESTGTGVIDLVFKDGKGEYVIVEVKEKADQETVGQVLKQSNGIKSKLGLASVRRAIVAARATGNVAAACKDAGVELYQISVTRFA